MEKEKKEGAVIAVTGGICTGKSSVLEVLEKAGAPVFSCDLEIKKIKNKNKKIQEGIKKLFPEAQGDNKIIAEIIFNDSFKKKELENLLYPELEKSKSRFLRENEGKIVFVEIPLLYEHGKEGEYDKVIVTRCLPDTQKQRAVKRGINAVLLEKIMESQLPNETKASRADYIIDSDKNKEDTAIEVLNIYKTIKRKQ